MLAGTLTNNLLESTASFVRSGNVHYQLVQLL